MPKTTLCVKVNRKKYSLDTVRYAAYAVSDEAFVVLRGGNSGNLAVDLSPRRGAALSGLKSRFLSELEDESLRETVADNNRELREFLVMKALTPVKKQEPAADAGLTAEQEKELEALIAQVEDEIKRDSENGRQADPLRITETWEDKYADKKKRKK